MTKKGISSPWAARAAREAASNNPLDGARKGAQPVILRGRRYCLIVTLPLTVPKEETAVSLGLQVVGECLLKMEEIGVTTLPVELAAQRLRLRERVEGTACVKLSLGPLEIWATASSTDEKAAVAMAVDRLVTALTVCNVRDPRVAVTLRDHFIQMVSSA